MDCDFDCQLHLLTLGDSGVGKTCFILRITNDSFSPTFITTIGIDFKMLHLPWDGKRLKLTIWDTGGQERFRTTITPYYRGSQGVMIFYDVTDRNSFNSVRNWIADIEMRGQIDVPKILIGTKCDVPDQRTISVDEGRALATEYGIPFFEVSSRNNYCCDEAFLAMVQMSYNQYVSGAARSTLPQHVTLRSSLQDTPAIATIVPRPPLLYSVEQSKFQQHWSAVGWKGGHCCHLCALVFGFFHRRHHCRVCGELVCSSHSLSRKLLPAFGYLAVVQRICDYCVGKREAVNMILAKKKKITFRRHRNLSTPSSNNEKSVDFAKNIQDFHLKHECHHEGGTSVLHLGLFAGKPCLLKRYKPWIAEAGQERLICREVFLLRQLRHPNIIGILSTNLATRSCSEFSTVLPLYPYIMLPHVTHGSLSAWAAQQWGNSNYQRNLFEWLWIVRMLLQLVSALQFMYSQGFAYNYLTTDHVVVCTTAISACRWRGEPALVQLIDFTNARLMSDSSEFTLPFPTHRSPQAWMAGLVDVSTEIFSFGMLIAQIVLVSKDKFLYNYPPDEAEVVLGEAIKSGIRPSLPNVFPVETKLKVIAQRCWNFFDVWERVQSELEFLEETLDQARIVQSSKEKDTRYEFTSLQAVWEPVSHGCFGPGPLKARYVLSTAQSESTSEQFSASITAGLSQIAAAVGYSLTKTTSKEVGKSSEMEFDVPAGKWIRIEQLHITGKAVKFGKTMLGSAKESEKEVDLSPNSIRPEVYDMDPSTMSSKVAAFY